MKNIKKKKLSLKNEEFCKLYASDKEFFGNGLQSYAEAYNIDLNKKGAINTAKANAYRLLTNADILKRINEIFEARGLNDTFVDKQLEKLIIQDADFKNKLGAIKEYNALKQRVVKKIEGDITLKDKKTEEIAKEIADEVANLLK